MSQCFKITAVRRKTGRKIVTYISGFSYKDRRSQVLAWLREKNAILKSAEFFCEGDL